MAYFTKGGFAEDPWGGKAIFSVPEWQEHRAAGTLPERFAVRLEPGFAVETIAADLDRIDLIKIAFPKFTDGRGYSMAWLLRKQLGYTGELRAVGDVLFDEMQFMIRCGFDSFDVVDPNTLSLLKEGRRAQMFDRFYQPGLEPEVPEGTRPWARRIAPVSGNLG